MSIASNIDFLKRLPGIADDLSSSWETPLTPVTDFGANPGNLAMWSYVPEGLPEQSPLVVVLHGCTQTAAAFDHGSGWTDLAARSGFAVLMPEQRRENNPNLCFSWFDRQKTMRGDGEVLSIHRMIATMVRLHHVSPRRIYIVGLSAGGAMASAMLAAYPEVFAAGAIIAGLPHGVADNLRQGLSAMASAPARSSDELGDFVRGASPHQGPWPRISVWHGSADRVVNPGNADQIAAQWRHLHGLPEVPSRQEDVGSRGKLSWDDGKGQAVVEQIVVQGLGHGVPLSLTADDRLGAAGPFMLEAGISSTLEIAAFFGLAPAVTKQSAVTPPQPVAAASLSRDVASVITRALAAAGLVK